MPVFVPFKAYRPTSDKAKAVACRPYDVLNAKEAKKAGRLCRQETTRIICSTKRVVKARNSDGC